jgi:uncharacterized protein YjbI with pentapeptide repeats
MTTFTDAERIRAMARPAGRRLVGAALAAALVLLASAPAVRATTLVAGGDYTGFNLASESHPGEDLHDIILTSANMSRIDFQSTILVDALMNSSTLSRANLQYADLTGANLSGANLNRANLQNANLSGANLSGANLARASLVGAIYNSATIFPAGFSVATSGMVFVPEAGSASLLWLGLAGLAVFPLGRTTRSD